MSFPVEHSAVPRGQERASAVVRPPPLHRAERRRLQGWWSSLAEELPEPFQGKDPFAPTEQLLRDQPALEAVQLPSGKVKEVPIGMAGRVSRRVDRWERLSPLAGRLVAAPIVPNWENGVRPDRVHCAARVLNSPAEHAALEDLLVEYIALGALEPDPEEEARFPMGVFPVPKKQPGDWRMCANARVVE